MTFQKAGMCVFAVRTLNTRDNVLAGVLLDCKKKNYNTNTRVFEFRSVKIQDWNMRSRGEAVLVATERERRRRGTRRWGLHSQTEWGAARGACRAHSCDH